MTKKMLIGIIVFCSCRSSSKLTGPIQEIRGDTLIGKYHWFTVKDAYKWKVGDTVSFTKTVKRSKINSKQVQ